MLKQRILTALVLLPLMLGMLFYAPAALWAAFAALIALTALWEYGRMCRLSEKQSNRYLAASAFFMLTAYLGGWQLPPLIWLLVLLGWLLGAPLWLRRKWPLPQQGNAMLLGWGLLLPFWFALLDLRPDTAAAPKLLALMVLVWLADVAAYFVGRACGKRKLAPAISPGKSWEGALGGAAAVLVYACWLRGNGWLFENLSWPATVLAALVLTAVSIEGDLLESWFKRSAGIKDSSGLLPGHGGVYDRTDSLIAVLAVYAAVQNLFG